MTQKSYDIFVESLLEFNFVIRKLFNQRVFPNLLVTHNRIPLQQKFQKLPLIIIMTEKYRYMYVQAFNVYL